MAQATGDQAILDKLFEAGEKAINNAFTIGNIHTDALKKLVEQQAQIAGALVDFGSRQYELLSSTRDPAAFVEQQSELGETFRGQWTRFVDSLREIGTEAGKRYTALAQELAEDTVKAAA